MKNLFLKKLLLWQSIACRHVIESIGLTSLSAVILTMAGHGMILMIGWLA